MLNSIRKTIFISISIDLKKAFDTVNHFILVINLEHYGVSGIPLQWF